MWVFLRSVLFKCTDIKYSPGTQTVANSEAWGDTNYVCSQYSQQRREDAEKDRQDHARCNTETGKDEFLKNVRDLRLISTFTGRWKTCHCSTLHKYSNNTDFTSQSSYLLFWGHFTAFCRVVCPNTNCVMWDKWCHRGFVWTQKWAQLSSGASIVVMSGPIGVAFICTLSGSHETAEHCLSKPCPQAPLMLLTESYI